MVVKTAVLKELETLYAKSGNQLCVLYGRPDLEKELLLKTFLQNKKAFYYRARYASPESQKQMMAEALEEKLQVRLQKYDYEEYLQIFSVVFQEFKLFAFPLAENIAAGEQVDKRRLKQVLTKIGLNEFVEGLPKKEYTLLYQENGEGVTPSGGEAQKVAIARALYKDAPFVILDEPTAALDPIAEAGIYENFDSLVGEKTAVYISHRMSSCKFCDRIVVLDHGEIAEEGTHEQLLEQNGIYAKLYQTQAEYYVTAQAGA